MSKIYERLAHCAEPFCFTGEWSFLPTHASLRSLPQNISPVLAGLGGDFSGDEFAAAGRLTPRRGTAVCTASGPTVPQNAEAIAQKHSLTNWRQRNAYTIRTSL